jgi:hypothetical protein
MINLAKEYIKNHYNKDKNKVSYLELLKELKEYAEFVEFITTEEDAKEFLQDKNIQVIKPTFPVSYLKLTSEGGSQEFFILKTGSESASVDFPATLRVLGKMNVRRYIDDKTAKFICSSNDGEKSYKGDKICSECPHCEDRSCKKQFDIVCIVNNKVSIFTVSGMWGYKFLTESFTHNLRQDVVVGDSTMVKKGMAKNRNLEILTTKPHNYDPQGLILTAVKLSRGVK